MRANLFDQCASSAVLQSGLLVDWLLPVEIPLRLEHYAVLITIGHSELPEDLIPRLRQFVEEGGTWIALGSPCNLPDLFGVAPQTRSDGSWRTLGEGYAIGQGMASVIPEAWGQLHAFGGVAVQAETAQVWAYWLDPHANETGIPAVMMNPYGAGRTILFAVNFGETLARLRMGRSLVERAVLPGDVPDEPNPYLLRADDATRLDWYLDREPCTDGIHCFLKPVADRWMESLVRAVLWAGQQSGYVVPMVWHYPRMLEGFGVVSIDCDPAHAQYENTLSHLLTLAGVRATWCVSEVGRQTNFYRDLARKEHEIGLRYVPESDTFCRSSTIQNQVDTLRRFTSVRAITAVQVESLQWRGCSEFFELAERTQIKTELSRGGFYPQSAGFLFGTAHPWQPISRLRMGETIPIWVLPLLSYRAVERVGTEQLNRIFQATRAINGVFHISVSPFVASNTAYADGFMRLLGAIRAEGYEWQTAYEVAQWCERRQALRHKLVNIPDKPQLSLLSAQPMARLGLLFFTPMMALAESGERQLPLTQAERYGFPCLQMETDLVEKSVREINFQAVQMQVA
ncbi:MAG: hypothetical protein SNJ72_03970 [Fimbriimonadales bacterium]